MDVAVPLVLREEFSGCGNCQSQYTACACETDDKSTDEADSRVLDKIAQSQHDKGNQRIDDQDIDLFQSFFDKYRGTQDRRKVPTA